MDKKQYKDIQAQTLLNKLQSYPYYVCDTVFYIKNIRCEFFDEEKKIAFIGVSVEYEIKIKLNTKSKD